MTGDTGRHSGATRILSLAEMIGFLILTAAIAIVTILPLGDRRSDPVTASRETGPNVILPSTAR